MGSWSEIQSLSSRFLGLGSWERCLESRVWSPASADQGLGVKGGVWSLGNGYGIRSLDSGESDSRLCDQFETKLLKFFKK